MFLNGDRTARKTLILTVPAVYVVVTKVGVISLLSPSVPHRLEHNAEQICLKKERNTVAQYCFPANMYMLQTSLPIAE